MAEPKQGDLPPDYVLIGKSRNQELDETLFNPPAREASSKTSFSTEFNDEIRLVMTLCSEFLARHGKFGSQERYDKGLPSDWWINDDFLAESRVLFIDILDCRMQTYEVIQGLRGVLSKLPEEWMLVAGHDNMFDNRGQLTGGKGSYSFWIRKEIVEFYAENREDLASFYQSLAGKRTRTQKGGQL